MAFGISLIARKLISLNELLTGGKFNAANFLSLSLTGKASTSQIEDRAVTSVKAEMGGPWFQGTDSGTATAHAVAIQTALTAPVDGMMVIYRVNTNCNGSAITLTITGDGGAFASAKALTWQTGFVPKAGEVKANNYIIARYSSSSDTFQILSQMPTRAIQGGEFDAASTANAWEINPETDRFAWASLAEAEGRLLQLTADEVNTDAVTLNYLGLGAKAVRTTEDLALTGGQITAGMQLLLTYNAAFNSSAGAWVVLSPLKQPDTRIITAVRQTVLSGPVDTGGHPDLLDYTGQKIDLKATTDDPFLCVFAAGFDDSGAVDYALRLTADEAEAWDIPTSDNTYYLFVDRDISTGAITYGYTTSRPTYIDDDAAPITTGVHTFLKNRMKMYLGNGTTAEEKQRVFVGECVVSGNVITSKTSYMFKGEYQSASDTAISSLTGNQAFTGTHKLGLRPASMECVLVAQGSTLNYAAGDEVDVQGITNSSYAYRYDHTWMTDTQVGWNFLGAVYNAPYIANRTTLGAPSAISAASDFKVRFRASRGW